MKYRVVTALIGVFVVMAAVTGCSSSQNNEPDTLVISDVEVLAETESESAAQVETMTIELEEESEESEAVSQAADDLIDEDETETDADYPDLETGTAAAPKEGEEEVDEPEETEVLDEDQTETEEISSDKKSPAGNTESSEDDGDETESEADERRAAAGDTENADTQQPDTEVDAETGKETGTEEAADLETEEESGADEQQMSTEGEADRESGSEAETDEQQMGTEGEADTESGSEAETDEQQMSMEDGLETETDGQDDTDVETESETEAESEIEVAIYAAISRVNIRRSPSTESEILSLLAAGEQIAVLDVDDVWASVLYRTDSGFAEGYIKLEYLEPVESIYTPTETVNVRADATVDSDKLGRLLVDDTIVVTELLDNGWSEVLYTVDGETVTAYVKSEYLTLSDSASAAEELRAEVEDYLNESDLSDDSTDAGDGGIVSAEEPETSAGSGSETESDTEYETDTAAADETETESTRIRLSAGAESQFQLISCLFPEIKKAGIIYSSDNQDIGDQTAEYKTIAETYGVELVMLEIGEEIDIDLAASLLVGQVECIFCVDDPMVNDLVQTICAYADEVEIPVIGILKEQGEQGCLAAYEDGVLYWNTAAAQKLQLSEAVIENFGDVTEIE